MTDNPVTLAPITELRQLLTAAGVRNAVDPKDLTPPGVLVQLVSFRIVTLGGGLEVGTRLVCVVPDADHERAADELVALVNRVLTVVDPDGPIQAATYQLPGDGGRLPGLAVPVNLYTEGTP